MLFFEGLFSVLHSKYIVQFGICSQNDNFKRNCWCREKFYTLCNTLLVFNNSILAKHYSLKAPEIGSTLDKRFWPSKVATSIEISSTSTFTYLGRSFVNAINNRNPVKLRAHVELIHLVLFDPIDNFWNFFSRNICLA